MKSKVVARGVRGTCLVALAISAMLAATLWAQGAGPSESYFIFPRFLSYQYQSTGIAVFNPGVRDATVRLTLRRWDGALVTTVPNPVEITVPARGQTARTAGELFGDTAYFDASLELWSPTPGLVAYYQAFDSQGTFIDGADAPASSMDLVFPVIPGPSEGAAEIDLMNPNPRSTAVELKAYSFGGAVLGKATVQVPAGGAYRSYPEDIFPAGTNLSGVSHIRATSKPANMLTQAQTVMGTSLFAGFSSYAPPGSFVDVAALNALPLAQAGNSNAVPYFRIGSDFASVLSLANLESSSNDVTLTAIANDGSALAIRRITLGANAGHRGPLQSILTGLGAEQEGWLLIQAAGRVTGALIYGRTDGASLAAVPLQPSPKLDFVFPQVVQSDSFYTELALVNPTPNTCYANVYVIGADGLTAAFNQVIVAPSKRASLRIGEIVPEVGQRAGGSIYVTAGEPLFAVASIWSEDGNLLSSFIPQQLGVSFYPAPLNSFAVTGRVTVNDLPAPGFVVILSGPSGGTAATDAFGYYAFTELLPGRYSMAVDQFGFEFIPTQAHFEIKGSSYRQNFQGYTAENSIVVQPSAIPAGSSDTTLQIFGNGFDSTSTAFVGNVRLQTAFIDSNRLEAVLPAFLVQTAARMEILVVTGPDGAAPRASRPHPIVAFLDRPELDKVQTPGNIAEGSPGASITLSGSGFLQNAKVKINGRSDGIQANWIDEGTIIAAVPGSYLQQGGIYPVTVVNPYPANVESNIQLLTVYYPAPAIEGILPQAVPARLEPYAGPVNLEVQGYGFRLGAVVLLNGEPLSTSYCGDPFCRSVRLYAQIPSEFLRSSGFAEITVRNPSPSLPSSHRAYLRIDGLKPTIMSVTPGSAVALNLPFQYTMPVIVSGTNFGPQTQVRVYKAGTSPPDFASDGDVISSEQMVVYLDVQMPDSIGEWKVELANPPPGGGQSDPVSFLVTEGSFVANPFLTSLNPMAVAAGGPSFTLTLNGTNFKAGSVVYFYYVPLVTTIVSDRQLRAEVPASLIKTAGRIPISIYNPDTGGASNRLFLEIR